MSTAVNIGGTGRDKLRYTVNAIALCVMNGGTDSAISHLEHSRTDARADYEAMLQEADGVIQECIGALMDSYDVQEWPGEEAKQYQVAIKAREYLTKRGARQPEGQQEKGDAK